MPTTDVYLVTGAGGGIGRAIARRLIADGHRVFALGRTPSKLEDARAEFGADSFEFATANLASAGELDSAVAAFRDWAGGRSLRGLVNNAAVVTRRPFNATTDDEWSNLFHVNLLAPVRLARALYPDLRAAAGASVLNISSNLAERPIADLVAYAALKGALNTLTAGLALEWAADHIRVNAICPGPVDTPMHAFHGKPHDPARTALAGAMPLGRIGQPAAAAFLLSAESSWTTGRLFTVDGGGGL